MSNSTAFLGQAYRSCEACDAVVPVRALCAECGYDFQQELREYRPAYRTLPVWLKALLGVLILSVSAFAVSLGLKQGPGAAEMPVLVDVAESPPSSSGAEVPDLADPAYVKSLVDSMMDKRYPLIETGDEVRIDIDRDVVAGFVVEAKPRHLVVKTDTGKRSVPLFRLGPDLRLRCDPEYRREYRRRVIMSELRRRTSGG